jgi:hydrogenase maturation protease
MERTPALVLGIGNLLWADEGFGVRCVEALHQRYEFPEEVRLVDGGTQGLSLVHYVCLADRVLVLDAVDFGDPPGTLKVLRGDEVPHCAIAKKMSLHQVGFQDVLAAAALLGQQPRQVALVGVQAAQLEDYGGSLSAPVSARLDDAVAWALAELAGWGFSARPRAAPAPALLGPGLDRATYEARRPPPEAACRHGDARLLDTSGEG